MRYKTSRAATSAVAAVAAALLGARWSSAASPAFSFEVLYKQNPDPMMPDLPDPTGTRPDDFHANGGGTTVTQDTIGATDATHSMKFTQVAGATFTAALTQIIPAGLNDASTFALSLDLTVPSTGNFVGNFANLGIIEFGNNSTQMGAQAQTTASADQNVELSPGTYHISIPLIARNNPVTFDANVPFSQVFGPDDSTQLTTPTGMQFFVNKSNDSALTLYFDNVQLVPTGAAAHWNSPDNGAVWSDPNNWMGGVPSGLGVDAVFSSGGHTPQTIDVDSPQTVGSIDFDNGSGYTLADQQITIDTSGADGSINELFGGHAIFAPLQLNKNTTFLVAPPTGTLLVSNLLPTARTVTKTGAGTLEVSHINAGGLVINGGTVKVTPDFDPTVAASFVNTSTLGATLTITSGGKLDIGNNKLVTKAPVGTLSGSVYTGVTGLVASGRNGGGWGGSGIITSQSTAITGNFTTIGVAKASDVRPSTATATGTWAGQTITGTDTLVMYTYGGDATLDGKINVDDYIRIDSGIASGLTGWSNGDFNYDGKVNIDDYTGFIDANIGIQGTPFATGVGVGGLGVTAVPEPASGIALLTALGLFMSARTRRMRRSEKI